MIKHTAKRRAFLPISSSPFQRDSPNRLYIQPCRPQSGGISIIHLLRPNCNILSLP